MNFLKNLQGCRLIHEQSGKVRSFLHSGEIIIMEISLLLKHLKRGAQCAVIDDPLFETENTILVDDCLFELQALAAHHRKAT